MGTGRTEYPSSVPSERGSAVVPGLGPATLGECVRVDDDRAAELQVGQVGLEGSRVHGDEDVGLIPGGQDVAVGDVHLEGGDASESIGGGADLGGVVREGGEVVAEDRRGFREAGSDQLHPVTRVTGKSDADGGDLLDVGFVSWGCFLGHLDAYLGWGFWSAEAAAMGHCMRLGVPHRIGGYLLGGGVR